MYARICPYVHRYGYNNIRELFGYKIDLDLVRKNPIARMDR